MLLDRVFSRSKSVRRVTTLTFTLVRAIGKLPMMRVLMAIRTVVVSQRFRHVPAGVTLGAIYAEMPTY